MQTVYGSPSDDNARIIGEWFAAQTKRPVHPPFSAIGWVVDQQLCGAAIFNDYNGSNIELHIFAVDERVTRQMIVDVFDYVFVRANCNRLTAKPYRKNKAVRKFAERLGFAYEATLKNYYGPTRGDDALVYRMDRATAERWLQSNVPPIQSRDSSTDRAVAHAVSTS